MFGTLKWLSPAFKFHYVSINSPFVSGAFIPPLTLNSIMFLLIRNLIVAQQEDKKPLNSIMFLLIQTIYRKFLIKIPPLNSIMFLLILTAVTSTIKSVAVFKFHYVSINSGRYRKVRYSLRSLNSIMFLLILGVTIGEKHTLKDL